MTQLINRLFRSVCAWSLCAAALAPFQAVAWEPTKPVEVIIPAGTGGASDQMARTIQGIVVKHQLMKQPICGGPRAPSRRQFALRNLP